MKLPQYHSAILRNEQKNRRPFKITDIDKIEQNLPPLLISEAPKYTTLPQFPLSIAETTNNSSSIQIPPIPIAEIPTHSTQLLNNVFNKITNTNNEIASEITPVTPEETQIGYNDNDEDLERLTLKLSKDFLSNDYKLDDSMLNPKTLLQCLIHDDPDIIPPPPEFCDLNYSPPQAAEKDSIKAREPAQLDSDDYKVFCNENMRYDDIDYRKNNFPNDSSNKMETLLLANEDYPERKPWIVTQSPAFRNTPTGFTASRANLNQFQFTKKKKFKIK